MNPQQCHASRAHPGEILYPDLSQVAGAMSLSEGPTLLPLLYLGTWIVDLS